MQDLRSPFVAVAAALAVASSAASQTYSRVYRDDTRTTTVEAVRQLADGSLVMAANTDGKYAGLVRIDGGGNPVWQFTYDGLPNDRGLFFDVQENALRDLIAVGHRDFHPYFGVVSSQTGQLRQSWETSQDRGSLLAAVPDATGGFTATGWITGPQGDADVLVVKVDFKGNEVWQRRIEIAGGDEFGDAIQHIGADTLIVGRTASVGVGGNDLLFLLVNQFGDTMWQRTVGTQGQDGIAGTPVVAKSSDGSFFVVAGRDTQGSRGDDVWLLKLSANGSVMWEVLFDAGVDAPRSVCATADGGCAILADTKAVGSTDSDLWLIKADALGATEWERRYGSAVPDTAVDLVATRDGGYACVARTTGFGASPAPGSWVWTLRLDSRGLIGQRCHVAASVASRNSGWIRTGTTISTTVGAAIPVVGGFGLSFLIDGFPTLIEAVQCATNGGAWTDLANATPGTGGAPELAGSGTMWPGTRLNLVLNGGLPATPGVLLLGTQTAYVPAAGMTIVPLPAATVPLPAVPANGHTTWGFTWPPGAPAGLEIFSQVLLVDPAGPQGFAATNGVRGRS